MNKKIILIIVGIVAALLWVYVAYNYTQIKKTSLVTVNPCPLCVCDQKIESKDGEAIENEWVVSKEENKFLESIVTLIDDKENIVGSYTIEPNKFYDIASEFSIQELFYTESSGSDIFNQEDINMAKYEEEFNIDSEWKVIGTFQMDCTSKAGGCGAVYAIDGCRIYKGLELVENIDIPCSRIKTFVHLGTKYLVIENDKQTRKIYSIKQGSRKIKEEFSGEIPKMEYVSVIGSRLLLIDKDLDVYFIDDSKTVYKTSLN